MEFSRTNVILFILILVAVSALVAAAIVFSSESPEEPPQLYCGDEACDSDENCSTCPQDCGSCPTPEPYCGDAVCGFDENCSTCPEDCGPCPTPEPYCGDAVCGFDENCSTCEQDCGRCPVFEAYCGDGNCDSDEDCSTCPQDCGECPPEFEYHDLRVTERYYDRGFYMFNQTNATNYCEEEFGEGCLAEEYTVDFKSSRMLLGTLSIHCGVDIALRAGCYCKGTLPKRELRDERRVTLTVTEDDCIQDKGRSECKLDTLELWVDNDPKTYAPTLDEETAMEKCYVDVTITGKCVCSL